MSFWRTKNSKKITSDSIAINTNGDTLKDYTKVESYEITNQASHTIGVNNYELRKNGKVVTLTINPFFLNSISANTWVELGQMPSAVYPSTEHSVNGILLNNNTANVFAYGRVVIRTNGSIAIKSNGSSTGVVYVCFSASWIIN